VLDYVSIVVLALRPVVPSLQGRGSGACDSRYNHHLVFTADSIRRLKPSLPSPRVLGGLRWSLKRAHFVPTALFDNEHSLTFAHGGDRLPVQSGDGRLVCRAVADNQCPPTLGQAFDHPLKR
jgi:hypothetical protein